MSNGEAVQVRFRDCECPGTPHAEEGDIVLLRPRLNYQGGAECYAAIMSAPKKVESDGKGGVRVTIDQMRVAEHVGPAYLRHGPIGWNVADEDGNGVPFDNEWLVAELPFEQAYPIVEAADDLYGEVVVTPFKMRTSKPSANGQTGNGSTSGRQKSTSKRPTRSARSSRNGSAATEPLTP
jgi:hypothetical protein